MKIIVITLLTFITSITAFAEKDDYPYKENTALASFHIQNDDYVTKLDYIYNCPKVKNKPIKEDVNIKEALEEFDADLADCPALSGIYSDYQHNLKLLNSHIEEQRAYYDAIISNMVKKNTQFTVYAANYYMGLISASHLLHKIRLTILTNNDIYYWNEKNTTRNKCSISWSSRTKMGKARATWERGAYHYWDIVSCNRAMMTDLDKNAAIQKMALTNAKGEILKFDKIGNDKTDSKDGPTVVDKDGKVKSTNNGDANEDPKLAYESKIKSTGNGDINENSKNIGDGNTESSENIPEDITVKGRTNKLDSNKNQDHVKIAPSKQYYIYFMNKLLFEDYKNKTIWEIVSRRYFIHYPDFFENLKPSNSTK